MEILKAPLIAVAIMGLVILIGLFSYKMGYNEGSGQVFIKDTCLQREVYVIDEDLHVWKDSVHVSDAEVTLKYNGATMEVR